MCLYNVALDISLHTVFTYIYNTPTLNVGQRVEVPFGTRKVVGFIVDKDVNPDSLTFNVDKLRHITQVFAQQINPDVMNLVKFAASYYHYPLGATLFTAVPSSYKKLAEIQLFKSPNCYAISAVARDNVKLNSIRGTIRKQVYQLLLDNENVSESDIRKLAKTSSQRLLKDWLGRGIIQIATPLTTNENIGTDEAIVPDKHNGLELNPLGFGNAANRVSGSSEVAPLMVNPLRGISLNIEQSRIVENIIPHLNSYYAAILYGITGSGKTEVYLELIYATLSKNPHNQVLVLVPEINLTPQLLNRFKKRFPQLNMVILNSHCTPKQRVENYLKAEQGLASVVIGTRLSIFTPFKQLSLIIIDEEHDSSFKQQEGLRYNARDLAVYRANYLKIPIILGSATPSLESLYNLKCGKYFLYKLTKRAKPGAYLPKLKLIDLRHQKKQIRHGISEQVLELIKQKLALNEVVLVFINRRGYSPQITCYDCGWIARCNNCSSNLVLHKKDNILKCHHCGYKITTPNACPDCGSTLLSALGLGTQKIEQVLQKVFADKVIERIDQDSVMNKNYWETLAQKINNHQIDIIVGTQMIAKGHDFPQITLVVVLDADSGLFSYDFRAPEHVFAQILQVAGRAGRGNNLGEVLLQTHKPNHEIYNYLINNDFSGFANYLLEKRRQFNLPPISNYAVFRASGRNLSKVLEYLAKVYNLMLNLKANLNLKQVSFYSPVQCVMSRLKGKERGQILIVSNDRETLHSFLNKMVDQVSTQMQNSNISWSLDVDPVDIY